MANRYTLGSVIVIGVTLALLIGLGAYGIVFLPKSNAEESGVPSNVRSVSCTDACEQDRRDCVLNATAKQGDTAACEVQDTMCKNNCEASPAAVPIEKPPAPPVATSTDALVPDPDCLGDCDTAYRACKADATMPPDVCVSAYNVCTAPCRLVEPAFVAPASASAASTGESQAPAATSTGKAAATPTSVGRQDRL
jgi:hypothetical protein